MYVWQIFLDMAVLVEAQGELLDNIETQVDCLTSLGLYLFLFKGKPLKMLNPLFPYFSN